MDTISIYQFISNHSKNISLIIILVLTIIITIHIYNSDSKKEGAKGGKDPFKMISDIQKMIKCPMTIFKNINTCLYFWLLDILFYIIWAPIYGICFIVFWILNLLYMLLSTLLPINIKKTFQNWGVYPSQPSQKGMCPSKESVMNSYESFYRLFSSNRFLYRDSQDIKKCYCVRPLISALKPLTNYIPFTMSNISPPSLGIYSLLIAQFILILIIVLYILNKGLKKTIQTGMNAISTFQQPKIAVGVPIPDSPLSLSKGLIPKI